MSKEFKFVIMDANENVEKQQVIVRKLVSEKIDLKKFKRRSPLPLPPSRPAPGGRKRKSGGQSRMNNRKKIRHFYGHGIPRVKTEDLGGRLIVVEGADGSGRSTQIARTASTGSKPAAGRPCRSA